MKLKILGFLELQHSRAVGSNEEAIIGMQNHRP